VAAKEKGELMDLKIPPMNDWTAKERQEVFDFLQERHQPEEWEAFIGFYSYSRWKRRCLRVLGYIVAFGMCQMRHGL